ncbi:hypothetical protein M0804_003432 [Polistes exclamans]|nr:hypothetical protein M0804_003432 [Polistes exclamans]
MSRWPPEIAGTISRTRRKERRQCRKSSNLLFNTFFSGILAQHNTTQHNTTQHNTTQHNATPHTTHYTTPQSRAEQNTAAHRVTPQDSWYKPHPLDRRPDTMAENGLGSFPSTKRSTKGVAEKKMAGSRKEGEEMPRQPLRLI